MPDETTDGMPFKPGPVDVAVGDVERALNAMWRAAAEATGPAPIRTTVANLLVYDALPRNGADASEVIARLTPRHPVRAIVLSVSPEAKGETLDAWVQMHCQISPGGRQQVCGEQITIHAPVRMARQLPAAALPLLLPDLPVVLYWRAGLDPEEPLLHDLARLSDRIVVDSSLGPDGTTVFRSLVALLDRYPRTGISDTNWARLTVLRELTAQFFDAPDVRSYLETISAVELVYGRDGRSPQLSQSLLYLGWLASRLSWSVGGPARIDAAGRLSAEARSAHGPVAVRIAPGDLRGDVTGSLVSVAIQADGEPPAHFEIERDEDCVCGSCRIRLGGRELLQRTVTFSPVSETDALSQELELLDHDETFEQAARAGAAIIGAHP